MYILPLEELNEENSKAERLENGNYRITGPDGLTEEVRVAYTNDEMEEMLEEKQEENSNAHEK